MAIGKASDFKIYNDQFFSGLVDQAQQSTAALGTVGIRLRPRYIRGDYDYRSFITNIANSITRRDTTSVSAATDLAVAMDEIISVKLNRKIGPIAQTLDAWRKAAIPFGNAEQGDDGARAFSRYLGAQLGKAMAVEMLNTSLLACRSAIEGVGATMVHTIAANGTMTTDALRQALKLFGDASDRIRGWVMHSKVYFDLVGYQTDPTKYQDLTANGIIYGGQPASFGRPIYVTDSSSLVVTGTPDLYRTIGITEDGIVLEESEQQELAFQLVSGLENLVHRLQGEFAYNLTIKGFKWDVANGGANPANAALSTGTNWDPISTELKNRVGVVIISG